MPDTYLYIGSWRGARAKEIDPTGKILKHGITTCKFDTESGKLTVLKNEFYDCFAGIGKCYIDKAHRCIYCTDERTDYPGLAAGGGGRVCAYRINPDNGALAFINSQPSYGGNTSYVAGDDTGKYLLVSNHGSRSDITVTEQDAFGAFHIKVMSDESNVVLFPINDDGSIGNPKDIYKLSGSGPKVFQHGPHAHCVIKAPEKNLYCVCDKGGDQVYMLHIDYEKEKLRACPGTPVQRAAGTAPRYGAFHPTLPYLYVNKEAEAKLSVFQYERDGMLKEIQVLEQVIPEGHYIPKPTDLFQSDLQVDPSGKRCYLFIRLTNIINCYDIDQQTGRLIYKNTVKTNGGAREAAFSPDGRFLAVSYTDDNRVDILQIEEDGSLGGPVDSILQATAATLNFYCF